MRPENQLIDNSIDHNPLKVVVPCTDSYEFVTVSDIIRCEGLQNYSRIYLSDGRMLVCTNAIGTVKANLQRRGFISCHRSHVINKDHILRYSKEGYVQMDDESCVPVSRRKKSEFIREVILEHCI